jgi:hypothetical protein
VTLKAGRFAQDRLLICAHGERKVIVGETMRRRAARKFGFSLQTLDLLELKLGSARSISGEIVAITAIAFDAKNSP